MAAHFLQRLSDACCCNRLLRCGFAVDVIVNVDVNVYVYENVHDDVTMRVNITFLSEISFAWFERVFHFFAMLESFIARPEHQSHRGVASRQTHKGSSLMSSCDGAGELAAMD